MAQSLLLTWQRQETQPVVAATRARFLIPRYLPPPYPRAHERRSLPLLCLTRADPVSGKMKELAEMTRENCNN